MKDKEKRIIETAKDMCFHADSCIVGAEDRCYKQNCETTWVAEKLLDLNYQKVSSDDIIISKKEYDRFKKQDLFFKDFTIIEVLENQCKQARQETAKDILNGLEWFFWETAINDTKYFDFYENLYRSIEELIKNKYGVDAKENQQ